MEQEKNISFRLKNIEFLESSIIGIDYTISTNTIFKFNINIEHLVNIDENWIAIKPNVEIFTEESNIILGKISSSLIFEFENLANYIVEKEVKLPSDIIIAMNSISISTIRGIMFSTFKGTYLHNAFLPVIDPKAFNIEK
ncbi:MAG: hypothetical protein FGM16_07155 [Flavobacterium sp.]|jgi:hypothetical protein|nr:hypothetical protein [Flavobacterium sp.]